MSDITGAKKARRILVAGGRHFHNRQLIYATLDAEHARSPIDFLIHGGCSYGADAIADDWATSRGIHSLVCKALWEYYGAQERKESAGPIRNSAMIRLAPDKLIAFPGGPGTADTTRKARRAGIEVQEIAP